VADSVLAFHHVGLLTDRPDTAARRLAKAGYQPGPVVFDPLQQVTLQLCQGPSGSATVELVTPLPENAALGKLLRKRADYMYHVCFTTPGFETALEILADGDDDRIALVSPPTPAVLFNNARVAFYLVPGLGLVELLERL
jgi:methylmalonyl-CoA/ethylmalonyl-CoA epimerase